MSAIQTVAALVEERGTATADDLLADMPDHTRKQVIKALQNAALLGLIVCDGRGPTRGKPGDKGWRGSLPGTYRAKQQTYRPRVSSVFDLARAYQ